MLGVRMVVVAFALVAGLTPTASAAIPGDIDGGAEYYNFASWYDIYMKTFDGGPVFMGNLTWSGGAGAIKWGENAASDDNVPAPVDDPMAAAAVPANTCLNNWGCGTGGLGIGPDAGPYQYTSGLGVPLARPDPDVFTSEALTRDVYIDPAHGIDVVLYLQTRVEDVNQPMPNLGGVEGTAHKPCESKTSGAATFVEPYWTIEVLADGKLIAAGTPPTQWLHSAPTVPDGYGVCNYPMAVETPVLRKGTILTVKVNHIREQYDLAYGLQGNHRSQIRIGEYSTEDALLRRPDLVPFEAGGQLGAPPETSPPLMAWFLPFALVAPLAAARGRSGAVLVVGVLLALAASGCLTDSKNKTGGTSTSLTGEAKETYVPLRTDEIHGAGNGTIFGVVHDDINFVISDVFITLQNTPNSTRTSNEGRFRFEAVPAGSYTVRFDHTKYIAFERRVEVKAGQGTSLEITLYLKNPVERDMRPHLHPGNWDGKDTYNMVTNMVIASRCDAVTGDCRDPPQRFTPKPTPGHRTAVFPGTVELEVKLNWDTNALGTTRLGLAYYTPAAGWDLRILAPRGVGETYHIQTGWETTDNGHATYSDWRFYWYIPLDVATDFAAARSKQAPGHDPGAVTVNMVLHQGGTFPWEAEHRDFWEGKDILEGGGGTLEPTFSNSPASDAPCMGLPEWPADACWRARYGSTAGSLVPPDTKRIKVVATLNRALSPTPSGIEIWYKTAATPPIWADPTSLTGYQQPSQVSVDDLKSTFWVTVTPETADTYYAGWWSGWDYTFRYTDEQAAWADFQAANAAKLSPLASVTFQLTYYRLAA